MIRLSRRTLLITGVQAATAVALGALATRGAAAAPLTMTNAQVRQPPVAPPVTNQPADTGELWVQNFEVTELWSGPNEGAEFFGWLRKFSYLRVIRAEGARLLVNNPRFDNIAWVNGAHVGPSGPPPPDYLEPVKVLAELSSPGRLVGRANIYAEPVEDEGVWIRTGRHNSPVLITAQVKGEGGDWFRLDTEEYVSGNHLRLPGEPAADYAGKWIDADLRDPTMVTAYDGSTPVASALAIRGTSAWQTPVGRYRIWRRVANETMSSDTIGIPRNAPGGYHVKDVLFTQYFSGDGAAIHYNYWSGNFGYPGSHGCLGMNYDDSFWFWNWADIGTPIVLHY